MAGGNASRTRGTAIALVAAALILSLPSIASASQCSRPERVDHRDAECLYAWWKNRGLLKKSPYHVSNQCSEYGKVVAKVDLVSARDRTIHLNDRIPRDGDTRNRIRGIACCSDMGICNRADAVTDAGCLARFRRVSPASGSCGSATASAVISGDNYDCRISARCNIPGTMFFTIPSSITVPWLDLDEVRNCKGWLRRGPCPRSRPDDSWLSVSDARADEAEGATLDFTVRLSRALSETVRVSFATSDGTARAGSDYRATSGRMDFRPGETQKTISVPVLDDELDEGSETLTMTVWNLSPLHMSVADPIGIGTIVNTDRMPKAWIGRFGRTVAEQVLDAVDDRMQAKPAPGVEAHVAGQRIGPGPAFSARPQRDPLSGGADASGLGQPMSGRELLPGTSFSLTAETGGKGLISIWGRGAVTRFAGRDAASAEAGGDVAVDGEVASGLLGADWTRGRWTTGLVLTLSRSDGGYRGAGGGTVSASLTGVWPWTRYALGERLSVWGVGGYGHGSLTLEPRAEDGTRTGAIRTDLDLWMAAVGLRGVALDGGDDGVSLAVKTDAMTVRTASDAVSGPGGNLAAAKAEVTRLRLGLEGSWPFPLGDGSVLTPSAEIGLRRDDGDAETGFGAEIGAGIAWVDPKRGLSAKLRGRSLLAHEAKGFREWGLTGSFAWDPETGDRGPRLSLTQTLGVPEQSGTDALLARRTPAGPATAEQGDSFRDRRLEARFGYGFPRLRRPVYRNAGDRRRPVRCRARLQPRMAVDDWRHSA